MAFEGKLLAIGDSNSSTKWGRSWPDFLSESLNYKLYRASSPGAGNAFYIEKLHSGLKEYSPDLVVVQLTEPSRVVLGAEYDSSTLETSYNHPSKFRDLTCYTWNAFSNEDNIKNMTEEEIKIDNFWLKYVSTSRWVDYKICQDIFNMYSLCEQYNTKVIFWSWFIPFEKLLIPSYKWLGFKIKWIRGCGLKFMIKNNQPTFSDTDNHYSSVPHKILTENFLFPNINSILKGNAENNTPLI